MLFFLTTAVLAAQSSEYSQTYQFALTLPSIGMLIDTFDLVSEATAESRATIAQAYRTNFPSLNTKNFYVFTQNAGTVFRDVMTVYASWAKMWASAVSATYYQHVVPSVSPHLNTVLAELDPLLTPVYAKYDRYVAPYILTSEDIVAVGREMKTQLWHIQETLHNFVSNFVVPSVVRGAGAARSVAGEWYRAATLPVTVRVTPERVVVLRHGYLDLAILASWWTVCGVVFILAVAIVWEYVICPMLRAMLWTLKFALVFVYMLVFHIVLALIFFILRVVTLNYMCKCCGLCASRKKPITKKVIAKRSAPPPSLKAMSTAPQKTESKRALNKNEHFRA